MRDASDISINWKTISPLHFSSSPRTGSDLTSQSQCPFSKSEQEVLLATKTTEDILAFKDQYLREGKLPNPKVIEYAVHDGSMLDVMENLNEKTIGGTATENDYANFADEILKFLEEQDSASSPVVTSPPSKEKAPRPTPPSPLRKSEDVDW